MMKELFSNEQPIKLCFILTLTIIFFLTELIFSLITNNNLLLIESYHMLAKALALIGCLITIKNNKKSDFKDKYTFGWGRLNIIASLMFSIFVESLSFSVLANAIETLVSNKMTVTHHPFMVGFIGASGLFFNGINFLLIGGCTGFFTDSIGCIFIITYALMVYFIESSYIVYVDPALSLVFALFLMLFNWPNLKNTCMIVLQSFPKNINLDVLNKQLLNNFCNIINIHDFHVWQLTPTKTIATVHIIFKNEDFRTTLEDIKIFFKQRDIAEITIQPEFLRKNNLDINCLLECRNEECKPNRCCRNAESTIELKYKNKRNGKMKILQNPISELGSIKIISEEFLSTI